MVEKQTKTSHPDSHSTVLYFPVHPMMDKKMLTNILNDLTSEEFEKFKSLVELEKNFPQSQNLCLGDIVEFCSSTYYNFTEGLVSGIKHFVV